jgi:hypothetical protein
MLIAHGANPNLADNHGVTPLMLAKDSRYAFYYADPIALLKQTGPGSSHAPPSA